MRPSSSSSCSLASGTLDAVGASSRFEQQDGHLAKIEVNEVLRLMRHVRPEVAADNTVPSGVVFLVKLLLDEGGNVLLNVVLLECLCCTVDRILLHVLCHVGILDHRLPICHTFGYQDQAEAERCLEN
eukprot:TRINITY_DN4275_c0_g2_i1.p1 TRINITY_DN4275_c0_g2~~TRINITY_DN4275_c0_g2_i1.p1  ORF type:complete len:128 (+),score=14.87 TRINITY_DN4275_c0_g2_i1:63-446(+)